MTNRDLANATRLAAWIVANGYRPQMTRKMVLRLVRTDPAAPKPVPSAGSETVYSLSQWRCYLDPTADPSQARQYLGTNATRTWWTGTRWRGVWSSADTHQL
jgi:hypothetical protein